VIVGKTNTPELGIVPTTESRFLGRCKSPWDTSLSTGGSSGGAAASVASGMVPMAHANDGGGSIRIPASACGVFGLKPTRARTPLGPKVGDVMNGLVCDHAVTRTVRDSAALLDAIEGPDAGDPYWAPPKARPFASEIGADPGKLRIAISVTSPFGSPVHADCVAAAEETAKLCESLGHHVEQAAPEIEGWALMQSFMAVWTSGVAMSVEGYSRILGRSPGPADLEPLTRAYCEMGKAVHAHEYLLAIVHLQQVSRRVAAFMQRYDVWLTPTTGDIAPRLGELDAPDDNPTASGARIAQFVPFTALANITGQPAMSVPLVWNGAGLPVGSQFFGRFGDEATLFRLASQLEQARPWRHRVPSL
jgi:amidase